MIEQKDLKSNLINTYPTKTAAANSLGLNESSIRRAIKYNRTVMGKFKFSYGSNMVAAKPASNPSKAKILLLDVETAPSKVFVFSFWKQNIGLEQIISNFFILTWSGKILGEDTIYSNRLTGEEALNEDDSRIMNNLWGLLNDVDIVIGHNSKKFDIPKLNSRFVLNGFTPPSPYKQIDTLEIARTQFGFTSNRLDHLANLFGIEGKLPTNFRLWKGCVEGNEEALYYMEEYNTQDVLVLESVYFKLRPYGKTLPNLDLYTDEENPTCPHCGSSNIVLQEDKFFYTQAVKYNTYRCTDCGAYSRSKQGIKYKYKKLISPIPR